MSKLDNKELIIRGFNEIVPNLKEMVIEFIKPMRDFVYVRDIEQDKIKGIKVHYTLVNSDYFIPDDFKEYEQYIEKAVKKCVYWNKHGISIL